MLSSSKASVDTLARHINSLTSSTLPELHQRHCRHLAYWELRAEEVMDRVFAVVTPAEGTAAIAAVEPAMAPAAEIEKAATSPWRQRRWWFVLGGLCLLSSSAAITAGLLWRGWMQARDELQHQRQLELIERLKPASEPAPAPAPMPPLRVEIPTVIPPAVTLDPASARHGLRWFEFDLTWQHVRLLKRLGLASRIRNLAA